MKTSCKILNSKQIFACATKFETKTLKDLYSPNPGDNSLFLFYFLANRTLVVEVVTFQVEMNVINDFMQPNSLPTMSVALGLVFLVVVLYTMLNNTIMFTRMHGRRHAINGLIYFIWISIGFILYIADSHIISHLVFDVVLGTLGTLLPLTAAYDFQHKNIVNVASGTLDEHATVTYNEMLEHSFYQALNLLQIIYLHCITKNSNYFENFILLFTVTSPWLIRSYFPINRFSDNYNKIDNKSTNLIRIMYRIKKYQYVFYKHFLLHGINITVAIYNYYNLSNQYDFRLYWLLLNLSYVMEFFLQTLVKKKYITQYNMLLLQIILMLASTIAALYVLQYVNMYIAIFSLILNFTNRNYDLLNTMFIWGLYTIIWY